MKAQIALQKDHALQQPCTAKQGHSERCFNPICRNEVEPNAKGDKFYCGDTCRQQASIIRRASKLLGNLSDGEVIEIVRAEQVSESKEHRATLIFRIVRTGASD